MNKIVLSHALYTPGMKALEGKAEVIIPNDGDSDRIIDELKTADGFILRIGKIDQKAIEACPGLKVITRPGVGVDNVDVAAATEHGIPVVICPASNSRAVAEHAMALIFAVSKNIVESDIETRKGNFNIRNKYAAVELAGKTVSIMGFGNIGRILGSLCTGVGMKAVVYDPFVQEADVTALGESYTYEGDFDKAVAMGDYVSLHMPSLPSTRGIMGAKQFDKMKAGAFFINCARGDLVDENALYTALKDGKIAGAGLDVLSTEPMDAENPIMSLSNVIISPHIAAQTQETTGGMVLMAVEGTLAVLEGKKWPDVCNPEVYNHPKWKGV